jgi:stage II sporulation protein AB (anti-sigma F factor)
MKQVMKLELDSISSNESFARVVVAAFLTRLNPTMEEVADIKTAVSEAVTNAIIHGYGQEIHKIVIEAMNPEAGKVVLSVEDVA